MNREELDTTIASLEEARTLLEDVVVNNNNPEAWPLFTGLPHSALEKMLEWAVVEDVGIDDLILTVASIAFAHGKKVGLSEATPKTSAASE